MATHSIIVVVACTLFFGGFWWFNRRAMRADRLRIAADRREREQEEIAMYKNYAAQIQFDQDPNESDEAFVARFKDIYLHSNQDFS